MLQHKIVNEKLFFSVNLEEKLENIINTYLVRHVGFTKERLLTRNHYTKAIAGYCRPIGTTESALFKFLLHACIY